MFPPFDFPQPWCKSHRADPIARRIADRHYNRQKPGTPQFVPPGSCCVFVTENQKAFWVTSYPKAEYVKHAWAGAWVCSAFRSEGAGCASFLIRMAIAATRAHYENQVPDLGMITFIDRSKVRSTKVRGAETWGYTWKQAGFKEVGETKRRPPCASTSAEQYAQILTRKSSPRIFSS